MELHQIRYVLAVAKAGSFTRAAEELFLAQPSLSVQVRKLEKELGVDLFFRLGRRVELTTAGQAFLEHAEPAMFHVEQARSQAVAVRDLARGRVDIGVLPSTGATLLPEVLARYRSAYPSVEVRIIENNLSVEFERMVQTGKLDLAIIRAPWDKPGVTGRVLVREPLVAMLPPEHPLCGAPDVDLAKLATEDFVGMHRGHGLRDLMDAVCQRHGFTPDVMVETSQLSVLWGMVRSGVGVSVVPRLPARGYETAVPLDDPGDSCRELGSYPRPRPPSWSSCCRPSSKVSVTRMSKASHARPARIGVAYRSTRHLRIARFRLSRLDLLADSRPHKEVSSVR
ncbi:MAG: LysR family transcriptional regulator [Pseudonocardiaceae bacterium]|nr:LysR family transcriptional regulator [Pseudonocardiaceae bacterium]